MSPSVRTVDKTGLACPYPKPEGSDVWVLGDTRCSLCGAGWLALYSVEQPLLQCPVCEAMAGIPEPSLWTVPL